MLSQIPTILKILKPFLFHSPIFPDKFPITNRSQRTFNQPVQAFLRHCSINFQQLYRLYTKINNPQKPNIRSMIVLFLNLHKPDEQGKMKFQRYHHAITKILKQTIYYGTHYEQHIRTRDNIEDFLYDEFERSNKQKAKQKFKSVTYIFIEGPVNLPPWSASLNNVALLIRNSLKEKKNIHFNAFGHIALYYYLSTGFDKEYCIRKKGENVTGKEDYFHEEETGDLYAHGKRICNSGIQVCRNSNRFFQSKSIQALEKGAVLATKFNYLAFNSKNGDLLIKNITFPFSFYDKHKVFCTPVLKTRANITTLIQTEDKIPIVFTYENCLSTHLICPQTLKVFINWITNGQEIKPLRKVIITDNENIPEISFDNLFSMKSTKNCNKTVTLSNFETHRKSMNTLRPQTATSSKSKFVFEKPSVRCSGPYDTADHIKTVQEINGKSKLLGRSRLFFKTDSEKNQIQNYVQRTPSRPPSAHNFRDINKSKWLDKRTFFVT